MSLLDALRVAFRAIAANGLRSILTTLGMVIGVGSVIVLIAVGQGAQKGVESQIRGLGSDLMFIKPGAPQPNATNGGARGAAGSGESLTLADAEALQAANLPGIKGVAAQDSTNTQIVYGGNNAAVRLIGTVPEYPAVRGAQVAEGEFISAADMDRKALTIVLGSNVASQLFPESSAVGETVRLSFGGGRISLNFKVAGVMAPKGGSGGGAPDDYVFAPVTTLRARFSFSRNSTGEVPVDQVNVQTIPGSDKKVVAAGITDLLSTRHRVDTPDFSIQSQADLIGAAGDVSRTLSILLGSIAGISLVVGGIGVMNIMLVSVTERTKEIGIRRAVGARRRDIILQFATEAFALCIGGGVLGVLIGVGVSMGIDGRDIGGSAMATVIQPWSIAVAFIVSAFIGATSGSYPAIRASRRGALALPRDARSLGGRLKDHLGDYYRQLLAPQRTMERDAQGNWVARWLDHNRADHYAHAELYCLMVVQALEQTTVSADLRSRWRSPFEETDLMYRLGGF